MAFRMGFASQGPPRAPGFGNFRMQFRPGFKPQNGSAASNQNPEPDLKVSNESGLLFISNIDEKCPNDLMKDMLDVFGKVDKWTRIQGPDGNFPPFGFCGYEDQASAVMAILTLNNFCIGNKKLNAKADEKAKTALVEFVINDRIAKRLSRKVLGKELEPDEGERDAIKAVRTKLRDILRSRVPELVNDKDDDLDFDEKKKSPADPSTGKRDSKRSEKKHRKRSHKHSKSRSRSRSKSKKSKKRRRSSSSRSSGGSHSDHEKRGRHRDSSAEHRINGLDSDDSDVVMDRKERKREQRRKDEDYLRMLKKFEERERRMAKQYEQEDIEERLRKKLLHKEAKKLAQFLEDYEDSRDDSKYYKDSLLSRRKKVYEEECEADNKDREEESKEIESITAMILTEKRNHAKANGSLSSSPQASSNQKPKFGQQIFQNTFEEEKQAENTPQTNGNEWSPFIDHPSTSQTIGTPKLQSTGKVITSFQNKVLSQINSVFADDDQDEDQTHVIKKKIKPFEITAQDRIDSLTAEERKQMVKELIEAIPTNKAEVFEYKLLWDFLDNEMIEQRVKPWLEKKIREYIGDDEPSLIEFICERLNNRSEPSRLLGDLAMILDTEAENFTLKLWRLLIYQTEARKVGLNVNSKP